MINKKIYIILILVLCLLPIFKISAQSSSAGFIPGNIWYSKNEPEEGEKIKIYTVLFNPDEREFSGTVIFFDKNIFLGKKTFTVKAKTVKDVSIDWTATVGSHSIFAKIENAKFLISNNKYEEIYLSGNQTEESKFSVSKKIIQNENLINNLKENILNIGFDSIENLENLVEEKTPDIITKPVIISTNILEKFRENIGSIVKNTKEETKQELEVLKNTTEKKEEDNKFLTPFKYVKFFFLSLISFIFNQKIIFYSLSLIIVFFFLRYIWRLVF